MQACLVVQEAVVRHHPQPRCLSSWLHCEQKPPPALSLHRTDALPPVDIFAACELILWLKFGQIFGQSFVILKFMTNICCCSG
jgi:hypothetical protein